MRRAVLAFLAACSSSDTAPLAGSDALVSTRDAPAATDARASSGDGGSMLPADDDFNGISLDGSWAVHNPDRGDIKVTGGQLRFAPHAKTLWYMGGEGALIYKLVTGDFKVTTTVHARLTADLTQPPVHGIQTGGLMARNQSFPPANYVFINAGFGAEGHLAVEHESTKDSSSKLDETPWGADAQLRLCRTGATFTVYKRNPGDTDWVQEYQVTRVDLPPILQVGPDVSAGVVEANSTFLFDAVDFAPVGAGCTQ